jgi:hypothetical protein
MDYPLTYLDLDLDLWLEVRLFGGLDRSHAYGLSNTTTKNLWMICSASTVGCSQSISSTQTPEFTAMFDQQVQTWTTHVNDKYEWLTIDNKELH